MKRRCRERRSPQGVIMSLVFLPVLVMILVLSSAGVAMAADPSAPADHAQYKADGTTAIVQGGTTDQATVRIKATVNDTDSTVQLQVEIIDDAGGTGVFTGTPNCVSPFMTDGSVATASCSGLTVGTSYKWQARTNDGTGTSAWVAYGASDPDVTVSSNFLIHNSASMGDASYGSWGVDGGTYGEFTCETCHVNSTTNIKRVRTSIDTPDASNWPSGASTTGPIVFTQADGTNSDMADTAAPFNGICNVCHDNTNHVHYSYNASDDTHNVGSDCTACHQHRKGFKGLDCNGCHGGSGSTGAPLINGDLVGVQDPYYAVTGHDEGAHPKHVTDQGITDCNVCHNNNGMPTVDEVITIGFSGTATTNSSSPTYDGTALDAPYSYNGGVTTATGTQDCSNVYCHSSVQGAGGTGAPVSYATPDWGAASVACDSCHGQATETDGQPDSGSHDMHAAAANNDYPCSTCHTGGSGTTAHADGTIDIAIDGTYGGTYGQGSHAPGAGGYADCSNVYCHGGTLTAGTDTQPTWGGAVACGECHGADAATPPTAGSHERHAGSGVFNVSDQGLGRDCTDCHGATAGDTGHTDSDVQWDVTAIGGTYSGSATGATGAQAPSVSYGSCATTYCHSNVQTAGGTAGPDTYASPTWGAASVTCDSCHGQDAEETDGQPATGSHDKHAGSQSGEYNYACSACHNNGGDETANHANNTINLDIDNTYGALAGYSQGDHTPGSLGYGTCSNVECHSDGQATPAYATPTWGDPASCTMCHGGAGGAAGGAGTSLTTSHTVHTEGTGFGYTCNFCHTTTVSDNTTIVDYSRHRNTTVNVAVIASEGGTGTDGGDYSGGSCATIYCHGALSPDWSVGGTTGDCSLCHGMAADPADGRDTNGDTGNTDQQVGAHVAHLNNTHGYRDTGISCSECHTEPTGATYVDKVKATGHIDSALEAEVPLAGSLATANTTTPDPYPGGGGACGNTYCHDGTNIKNGWSTAAQIEFETPDWNTPIMNGTIDDCDNCHGNPPAGSHTSSTSCNSCHTHVNATQDGFIDASLHIDGSVIAQQGGACNGCHAYPPNPGDGKTEQAIEGKGAHMVHVEHLSQLIYGQSWSLQSDPDNDQFGTGTPGAICGICHTNTADPNHMDSTRQINFGDGSTAYQFGPTAPAYNGTVGVGGASDPKTCSNISCHFTETPEWEPRQ